MFKKHKESIANISNIENIHLTMYLMILYWIKNRMVTEPDLNISVQILSSSRKSNIS